MLCESKLPEDGLQSHHSFASQLFPLALQLVCLGEWQSIPWLLENLEWPPNQPLLSEGQPRYGSHPPLTLRGAPGPLLHPQKLFFRSCLLGARL